MKLTEQEKSRLSRGQLARDFLQCEFLQQFLMPFMDKDRMEAYPKPEKPDWQEKYRYAFAKDEVYTKLMETIVSWKSEAEALEKKEGEEEKSIVDA